jgi:hypothetical protein
MVAAIGNIDVPARIYCQAAWYKESSTPLAQELPSWIEFLSALVPGVSYVNIASRVYSYTVRLIKLPIRLPVTTPAQN